MSTKPDAESSTAPIRVLVWDEQQPEQRAAYPEFLGQAIANHLSRRPGLAVRAARLDDPEQGLAAEVLDATDVLVWWGHRRHPDVDEARVADLVRRIEEGQIALLALHSSHWSRLFIRAMEARAIADAKAAMGAKQVEVQRPIPFAAPKAGAPVTPHWCWVEREGSPVLLVVAPNCGFPTWRRVGGPSRVTTLLPEHPIAAGVPTAFDLRETEMYSEPFHVPEPDAVIFEERWPTGEHFRTGMTWRVGRGEVFYFGPGHETYDVFRQEIPLRIIENAVRYLRLER